MCVLIVKTSTTKKGLGNKQDDTLMYEHDDRPINEVTFVDNFHNLESKNGSFFRMICTISSIQIHKLKVG